MARIADRDVLSDVQVEVPATGAEHKGAGDRRSPNDFGVDETLDVLQDRIALITGLAQSRVRLGAQEYVIRTVDTDEAQLVQGFSDRLGIGANVGGEGDDRIAGPLADAFYPGCGIAFKD